MGEVAGLDRQRGSVLMLMPAAVLIVIILGALAVDRAIVFGAQRDLVATAQAAADDAVAAGVDVGELRDRGSLTIDRRRIDLVVATSVAQTDGEVIARWRIEGDELVVRLVRRVDLIFSPAVPGGPQGQVVTATARSELVRR